MGRETTKCRHASPGLIDRLLMWFGFERDLHFWIKFQRQYKNTLFYCRNCECGAEQILNCGPMGNRQWRNVSEPWRYDWEKERFNNAKPVPTIEFPPGWDLVPDNPNPPPPPSPRSVTGRQEEVETRHWRLAALDYINVASELRRQNITLREAIISLQDRIDFLTKKQLKKTEKGNRK